MEAAAGPYFRDPFQLFSHSLSTGNRICCEYGGAGTLRSGKFQILDSGFCGSPVKKCQQPESRYSQLRYTRKKIHPETKYDPSEFWAKSSYFRHDAFTARYHRRGIYVL